jgi:ubiquinone/menaquinone biosynthesis C-methylase UbiE
MWMNLYSRFLFPRLMDLSMSGEDLAKHRRTLLADVTGEVLEIGFGTGLNLNYYPPSIRQITTVDVNPGMSKIAVKRAEAAGITVIPHTLSGENLPMADGSFDSVVSTWTLCSIPQVEQAMREVYRVLKPDGKFFFVEHGLSDDASVQVWQQRLNPIQNVLGDGCNLNRNIRQLVAQTFSQVEVEAFPEPSLPQFVGYFYKGTATKVRR